MRLHNKRSKVSLKLGGDLKTDIRSFKKDYGIFFTPEWVVGLMVKLIDYEKSPNKQNITILEPACGLAQLLTGIKRNTPILFEKSNLMGVEMNKSIVNYLDTWDISKKVKIVHADYLLWEGDRTFDVIIGNPPYGIPSLSDHYTIKVDKNTKQKYKTMYETWHGKYNVYGAFMEKSIKLLRDGGQLIFIIPATFMILDEFKKLRQFLSKNGTTHIIYMGPRVFRPEADVSSVILDFRKSNKCTSLLALSEHNGKEFRFIKKNKSWHGEIITFETEYTRALENMCSYRLGDVYKIRISPRTPEIKYNNYVMKNVSPDETEYSFVLDGRNLKCYRTIYENFTGYWIKKENIEKLRKYFSNPHIVVGLGFREDGRIAAAYDEKCYPWMGDVYHLLRENTLFTRNYDLDYSEMVAFLNSDYVKRYVKELYREITYHLSITRLKKLPIPTKIEWERIKAEL